MIELLQQHGLVDMDLSDAVLAKKEKLKKWSKIYDTEEI
jgi:hypothetical protein